MPAAKASWAKASICWRWMVSARARSSPDAARGAAAGSSGLASNRMQVSISGRGAPGSHVTVTVTYRAPTDVPLIGAPLGDVEMHASATMRVEN